MWRFRRSCRSCRARSRSRLARVTPRCCGSPRTGAPARAARPVGQGRGRQPDRLVQGARAERRDDARGRRRRRAVRAAHRRQRRRALRRRTARRAGVPVRVYAPRTTPRAILAQMRVFGAELVLLDGTSATAARRRAPTPRSRRVRSLHPAGAVSHRGQEDARASSSRCSSAGRFPAAIIYPTGGGTGLIGMWKAFLELRDAGWVQGDAAPHVHGAEHAAARRWSARSRPGAEQCAPWPDPVDRGQRAPRARHRSAAG